MKSSKEELQDRVPHEPFKCATEATSTAPLRDGALRRPKLEFSPKVVDFSSDEVAPYALDSSRSDQKLLDRKDKQRAVLSVSPLHCSRHVQTDALSIDLDYMCPMDDFRRSENVFGKRESEKISASNAEILALRSQVRNLKSQLRGQEHIHEDLKKLLVGSLGDGAYRQLFQLTSETVRLNEENSQLRQKIGELSDQLDRTAIEADMWRSKFVAGRVMLDELAGWKAQLSVRYQESAQALRQMLQERQQIRNDLCELYRILASHDPKAASELETGITNSVELAIGNRQLARKIVGKDHCLRSTTTQLQRCREYTDGEKNALDALANQPALSADNTMRYNSAFQSPKSKTYERLTLHSCKKCKGEVNVV